MKPEILTYSQKYFNFLDPRPEDVDIASVARGLSNECRFSGQCEFYSVAEHSVLMSEIAPHKLAFQALMHDAAEAYIRDMAKPLKILLPDYTAIEKRVESVVFDAFGLPQKLDKEIKRLDLQMQRAEQFQVMNNCDDWSGPQADEPASIVVKFWSPQEAFFRFKERFDELV